MFKIKKRFETLGDYLWGYNIPNVIFNTPYARSVLI